MADVFISFLGLGNPRTSFDLVGYEELEHHFEGTALLTTPFAQVASILASGVCFDRIVLLVTPKSKARHAAPLAAHLEEVGVASGLLEFVEISDTQDVDAQWAWFHAVLQAIEPGDDVVFDFTHGFRSVPIVLSSAISFLQKAKPFRLRHGFYTFVNKPENRADLVDLAAFYEINRWADALNSLLRGGDATHLAELASDKGVVGFPALRNPELVEAMRDVTRAVKDVDMNGIAKRASAAVAVVQARLEHAGVAERSLLEKVLRTYEPLAVEDSGKIDVEYFRLQLAFAGQMLTYGLRMQAYTVMRELIGSIGILGAKPKYRNALRSSDKGRKGARAYANALLVMCAKDPSEWAGLHGEIGKRAVELEPLWRRLTDVGIWEDLCVLVGEISKVRNGLNHGWTSQSPCRARAEDGAAAHLDRLSALVDKLEQAPELWSGEVT